MSKSAIVTVCIGEQSRKMLNGTFVHSWELYAKKHNMDIVRINEPIDAEDKRHPAWQKLLFWEHPSMAGYDRAVYVDHDVFMNPSAPSPIDHTEPGTVGAVTWAGSYHRDKVILDTVFIPIWRCNNAKWVKDLKPESFADLQEAAGYGHNDEWLNSGVMVWDREHKDLMRHIYETGLSNERSSSEQSAITHHLCVENKDMITHLDRRFNAIWDNEVMAHYSFLPKLRADSMIAMACVESTLANNYFLHFINGWTRNHAIAYAAMQKPERSVA